MRRKWVLCISVLLVLASVFLPILLSLYLARVRLFSGAEAALHARASRVHRNAGRIVAEAVSTLRYLNSLHIAPCTPEHLKILRNATAQVLEFDGVGYYRTGTLMCTSWGLPETSFEFGNRRAKIKKDLSVRVDTLTTISPGTRLVDFFSGAYNILIDPRRFVHDIQPDGVGVAVFVSNGGLLLASSGVDPLVAAQYLAGEEKGRDGAYAFGVAGDSELRVVAVKARAAIDLDLMHEYLVLVPMGGAASLFLVCCVLFLSRRRLSVKAELLTAIERREFYLNYQPIIETANGRCVGAEALIRWRHPDGQVVRPDLFVASAEEFGLIEQVTDEVFRLVAEDLGPALIGAPSMHIAINLSAQDMVSGRWLGALHSTLARAGIPFDQIWLEATERGFRDVNLASITLVKAREAGHRIAIDDFGTGYSSLSALQHLPLDALKIDKAFVDAIGVDAVSSSVVDHIIELAKSLDLLTVAEGVEHKCQYEYLIAKGVNYIQGWYFSKPLSAADFIEFYQQRGEEM